MNTKKYKNHLQKQFDLIYGLDGESFILGTAINGSVDDDEGLVVLALDTRRLLLIERRFYEAAVQPEIVDEHFYLLRRRVDDRHPAADLALLDLVEPAVVGVVEVYHRGYLLSQYSPRRSFSAGLPQTPEIRRSDSFPEVLIWLFAAWNISYNSHKGRNS